VETDENYDAGDRRTLTKGKGVGKAVQAQDSMQQEGLPSTMGIEPPLECGERIEVGAPYRAVHWTPLLRQEMFRDPLRVALYPCDFSPSN
jgi:hypothetical protein